MARILDVHAPDNCPLPGCGRDVYSYVSTVQSRFRVNAGGDPTALDSELVRVILWPCEHEFPHPDRPHLRDFTVVRAEEDDDLIPDF